MFITPSCQAIMSSKSVRIYLYIYIYVLTASVAASVLLMSCDVGPIANILPVTSKCS
jgi:hypothetical protein